MTRHTYDTEMELAGTTVPVEVTFDFDPGYKGGRIDPPCPPCAEIVSAYATAGRGRHECPAWMLVVMSASEDFHNELVGFAIQDRKPDPDEARDAAMEMR
ncbi:hypothetical protein [Bosea minatitlanensis]|uniref:Uncharacterized protein n=1 Tax=Bosea minatitlanensis TaxID=128782 RepID=A0ABW0F2V3_9HYPH|nr:hypothetical protein [Bosea minatitlanensis]MCT4492763.1 hypothetical protein [Bosea minatitlanensis]